MFMIGSDVVVLLVVLGGVCVLYTTYPSASVAFTAVQLMVALVAFLWSRVSSVGVKLGAEQEQVVGTKILLHMQSHL